MTWQSDAATEIWSAFCFATPVGTRDEQIERMAEIIAEKARIGGWISVDDGLPEKSFRVLTWHHEDSMNFGWYSRRRAEWTDDDSNDLRVTHWMPLPDPPERSE